MSHQRSTRLAELVKAEVSDIILKQLKDPRVGFVSVTDVEVSQDLRYVKVFVSVLGGETEKKDTMKALDSATGFIRSELGKRIKLRYTPEIAFKHDISIERGTRIFKILNDIKSTEPTSEPTDTTNA